MPLRRVVIFYSKTKEKHTRGERSFEGVTYSGSLKEIASAEFDAVVSEAGREWVIMSGLERSIFNKISRHKALKDWDIKINYGIKTGYNEAFIIDEETKERLIKEDKNSAEIIKPLLRGRDIDKYIYHNNGLYLINTHNGIKEKNIPPINIKDYPAIKKHLDKYYKQLEKRQDKVETPYNLRNCAYLEEFEKDKIVWTPVNGIYSFAYVEAGYYFNNSLFMITDNNNDTNKLKYLLAILNTATLKFGSLITPLTEVGQYTYGSKEFMQTVPIPEADSKTKNNITKLVDDIIMLKKQDKDTTALEKKIDEIVYSLYGLSDEEVKVVEG